jgi:predicted nucleotidyltransferase component of viral defense system
MVYDFDSIKINTMKEDQEYKGTRVLLNSTLGKTNIPVQLDIGTGDTITPHALRVNFKVIINELPAPQIKVYNQETVIAEKLQAMVSLDLANSRMKDFYDIWFICMKLELNHDLLAKAIAATFKRRGTEFPKEAVPSLTDYFYAASTKKAQWKAFVRKSKIEPKELTLKQVCHDISRLLSEVFGKLQ